MSGDCDRVDKFEADCLAITAPSAVASKAEGKVQSETARLATWLCKHQGTSLPDGQKQKIMTCVQTYHKFAKGPPKRAPKTVELVHKLVDDLLKLPEGKLVSAKAKKLALKWLLELQALGGDADGEGSIFTPPATLRLQVLDVELKDAAQAAMPKGKKAAAKPVAVELELMDPDSADTSSTSTEMDRETLARLRDRLDGGEDVFAEVREADGGFVRVLAEEGEGDGEEGGVEDA